MQSSANFTISESNVGCFIGVDAGGSSSEAVSLDAKGAVVRQEIGPPGNPHVHGYDVSVRLLSDLVKKVMLENSGSLKAILVALSGGDSISFCKVFAASLRNALKLPETTKISVTHDLIGPLALVLTHQSMFEKPNGQRSESKIGPKSLGVVIAGTGSVAGHFQIHDIEATPKYERGDDVWYDGSRFAITLKRKCGGRGPLLGDFGSGYYISTSILTQALRAYDGLRIHINTKNDSGSRYSQEAIDEAATEILQRAFTHFGMRSKLFDDNLSDLIAFIHSNEITRGRIASFCDPLSKLAAKGNIICRCAFRTAGEELGEQLVAAMKDRQGGAQTGNCQMIASGGVFRAWNAEKAFQNGFTSVISPLLERGGVMLVRTGPDAQRNSPRFLSHALDCGRLAALMEGFAFDATRKSTDFVSVRLPRD